LVSIIIQDKVFVVTSRTYRINVTKYEDTVCPHFI